MQKLSKIKHSLNRHPRRSRRWQLIKKHPVTILLTMFFGLCVVTAGLFVALTHGKPQFQPISNYIVILSYDHGQQIVPTKEPTIGALLKKLDIKLAKNDRIEPSLDTPIKQDNLRVNIYRAMPVEIIQNGESTFALSAGTTPRSIARQAGVKVYPEDNVSIAQVDNFLPSYSLAKQVIINPATPVYLNLYGTPAVVRTHAVTVGDLLKQNDIIMHRGDTIEPSLDTLITPSLQVIISHQGTKIVTETESIPAPVQKVRDSSLSFGTSAVRQQGSPGQKIVTYQINTVNGQEVGRTQLQTVTTVQPVPQIIAQGDAVSIPADKQAVMAAAGIAPGDYRYVDYIMSRESGWCPTKWQGQIGYCPGYFEPLHNIHGPDPSTGRTYGYGIGQATPAAKMAIAGSDWQTNVVTQLKWADIYAKGRFKTWQAAYEYWSARKHW